MVLFFIKVFLISRSKIKKDDINKNDLKYEK
jgi:hypothetical protein